MGAARKLSAAELAGAVDVGAEATAPAAELQPAAAASTAARRSKTQDEIRAEIARGLIPEPSLAAELGASNDRLGGTLQRGYAAIGQKIVDIGDVGGIPHRIGAAIEAALGDRSYSDLNRQFEEQAAENRAGSPLVYRWGGAALDAATLGVGAARAAVPVAARGLLPALRAALPAAAKAGATAGALGGAAGGGTEIVDRLAAGSDLADAIAAAAPAAKEAAVSSALLGAALHRFTGHAPERAEHRLLSDIAGGEGAETSAKLSTVKKVEAKAGPHGEALREVAKETGLERALSTQAATSPAAVGRRVAKAIDKIDTTVLEDAYARMDAAGGIPKAKVMGDLAALRDSLLRDGRVEAAKIVEGKRAAYEALPDEMLPATALRGMKAELGARAFASAGPPSTTAAAQRKAYGVLDQLISDAAEGVEGVDVRALKKANRQVSTLIPVRDALLERGAKAHAGRHSWSEVIHEHALEGVGGTVGGLFGLAEGEGSVAHGVTGAVIGKVALPALSKAGGLAARNADYMLAKLVRAAEHGSTAAQVGRMAVEAGLSSAAGVAIARAVHARRGSEPEAVAPAPRKLTAAELAGVTELVDTSETAGASAEPTDEAE